MASIEQSAEMMRALLAGRSFDSVELWMRSSRALNVETNGDRIQLFNPEEKCVVSLGVIRGRKRFQSYVFSESRPSLVDLIDRCDAALDVLEPEQEDTFPVIDERCYEMAGDLADSTLAEVGSEEKINRLINLEQKARDFDVRIKHVQGATYRDETSTEAYWTTGSKKTLYKSTSSVAVSLTVAAEDRGEMRTGYGLDHVANYYDLNWSRVAQESAESSVRLLGARKISTQKTPVLFVNTVALDVLDLVSHSLRADLVLEGRSFFTLRDIGANLFSQKLRIWDDPQASKRCGSTNWDAEGYPSIRQDFCGDGRLLSLATHRSSARDAGLARNGHAKRGSESARVSVGFHNLVWDAGDQDFVDLCRQMNRGIIVYQMNSIHTVSLGTGDFSLDVEGVVVEGGEAVYPFSGVCLAGNIKDLLKRIVLVGRDLRIRGAMAAPSFLCDELQVAGS